MKRDSVSAYVHKKCDTPLPLHICKHFGWLPYIPLVTYILGWIAYFSSKRQISTFEYCIHWNINIQKKKKILYEKINDSVVWNKHSGEQY